MSTCADTFLQDHSSETSCYVQIQLVPVHERANVLPIRQWSVQGNV